MPVVEDMGVEAEEVERDFFVVCGFSVENFQVFFELLQHFLDQLFEVFGVGFFEFLDGLGSGGGTVTVENSQVARVHSLLCSEMAEKTNL